MKNYSKQRAAIVSELSSRHDHPTASEIYAGVRKTLPNISLGTVYRNLSDLVSGGEIICIDVGEEKEHYDFDNSLHLHLHCKGCGSITDVPLEATAFDSMISKYGFCGESGSLVLNGVCEKCAQK